jgi:hypothetical protein
MIRATTLTKLSMNIVAGGVGVALAFVTYRMYQQSRDVKPKESKLQLAEFPLKNGKHYPQNSTAENIDHVQQTTGYYGLPAWIIHYRDGTQTAKLYTPPTEITSHVGPTKESRMSVTERPPVKAPPPITAADNKAGLTYWYQKPKEKSSTFNSHPENMTGFSKPNSMGVI